MKVKDLKGVIYSENGHIQWAVARDTNTNFIIAGDCPIEHIIRTFPNYTVDRIKSVGETPVLYIHTSDRYWEVEFECDNSWSISGVYSFFMKQEHKPSVDEICQVHGVTPYLHGLGGILSIHDITDDLEHYEGIDEL